MITILGFILLLFIPVMISEKNSYTGWVEAGFNAIPAIGFGFIIGLAFAIMIPYKTETTHKRYTLEKIGDSYIQSEDKEFTILYNSKLTSDDKSSFEIKNADTPSVVVHQKNKTNNFWNYFSVGIDKTTYTVYIPTK